MSAFNQLDEENPIYPTGIPELDKLIIGFEPGTLTLLAAKSIDGQKCPKGLALRRDFFLSRLVTDDSA